MTDAPDDTRLWAWMELGPDGRPGIVAVMAPNLGVMMALVGRSRHVVETSMRQLAQAHAKASGNKVWLREYQLVANHEDA